MKRIAIFAAMIALLFGCENTKTEPRNSHEAAVQNIAWPENSGMISTEAIVDELRRRRRLAHDDLSNHLTAAEELRAVWNRYD